MTEVRYQREVADGEAGPNQVKQAPVLIVAVEEHLAANRLKAQQVRVNLTVARRLQEEEDEQSQRLDRKLCRQSKMDLENHCKQTSEEEFPQWDETRQRSHTEQRKNRVRRFSGETGRRSKEGAVKEKRAEASPWHGIRYSQPRSRQPFIASKRGENAEWCRREGEPDRPHRRLDVEGEHEANGFGTPQEMDVGQQRQWSPASCWDYIKQAEEGGDSPEGGDPLARTHGQLKGQRTRRGPEGRADSRVASTPGHLAVLPPAGSTDEDEYNAFQGSVSDSESRQRCRRSRGELRAMRARTMSEDGHRTTRDRRGHKRSSPGPHLPVAETPPRPQEQLAMERRAVDFHPPLGPTGELMQSGRWKVGGGRTPLTTKGLGMENHWPLSRKEREANYPLAGDQKHIHRPLAVSQKHVHRLLAGDQKDDRRPLAGDQKHDRRPLAGDQKHDRRPLAGDQKHVHCPLAGDQKHVHRPLAGDQKHDHCPLAGDQKHDHRPLAGDQKHVHRPLAGDQKHDRRPLAGDQKHVHRPLAGDQKHVHWPLPVGEDQVHRPLPPNQRQAQYPLVTNHTLYPYIHHPPQTKAKGKQVHFLLAASDRASPSQMQLAQRDRQIQFLLDSTGKDIQSSSVGKQKRVHFPLAIGEKGIAVHSPLVKDNDAQHSLATKRKELRSPLAVKPKPIQYRLDSKDAETIIDYVLENQQGKDDWCPNRMVKSPAVREDGSGQSRDSPREVVPAKARPLVSKTPGLDREKPHRAEKDSSSYPCSGCPDVRGGSADSFGCSDGATHQPKLKVVDRVEAPRGRHRQPRSWDVQGRRPEERRKPDRSRPHSPSDGLPAEAGKHPARSKGSAPRNGLPTSLCCSDETLKALQALELRRVQLQKAAADKKQLQLARDEEFALDLLRREITAMSLSGKEKCCHLMQGDEDVPGRRRKESPRSDSPSSVNVDWVEEPQLSKSAFF
ncbi:uncharacterized protein LOC134346899 isoform X4 [Mobula hypostoma]|uniref:uncharacterized protein LOC134346899 isoform X4 n=1 Tax=Mobula hypostoma TaxID=723540 RepID=UPI002FC3D577